MNSDVRKILQLRDREAGLNLNRSLSKQHRLQSAMSSRGESVTYIKCNSLRRGSAPELYRSHGGEKRRLVARLKPPFERPLNCSTEETSLWKLRTVEARKMLRHGANRKYRGTAESQRSSDGRSLNPVRKKLYGGDSPKRQIDS